MAAASRRPPPSAATPDAATVELAARLTKSVVHLARDLRHRIDGGLTSTQITVIGAIYQLGPVRMSALAERERLSPSMITKVVNSLLDLGLVEQTDDATDGRARLVDVSASGVVWCNENSVERDVWLANRLSKLPDRELRNLAMALPTLEALAGPYR